MRIGYLNPNNIAFGRSSSNKFIQETPNSPVSDKFLERVKNGIDATGIVGQKVLKRKNMKVKVAQDVKQAFPVNKYPLISQSSGTPGIVFLNKIGVFENHSIKFMPPRPENVTRHEIAHQLDLMFKDKTGTSFVNTDGYKKVYLEDLKNYPKIIEKYSDKEFFEKNNLVLTFMKDGRHKKASELGLEESFAKVYELISGGFGYKEYDKYYKETFPKTIAYVEKLLHLLGPK